MHEAPAPSGAGAIRWSGWRRAVPHGARGSLRLGRGLFLDPVLVRGQGSLGRGLTLLDDLPVALCGDAPQFLRRAAGARLLRDNVVIHEGKLKTLKRFKDEVREVQSGQECGMAFENYDDIREGDVIEIFETEQVERQLA